MERKGGSCSILQSRSLVSGDAWTSRRKSQISAPIEQCLSHEYMPDLHGKSWKLSQNWKAGYAWFQLDSCLLAICKAKNYCLCIQAIVFEFNWIPNDVSFLTVFPLTNNILQLWYSTNRKKASSSVIIQKSGDGSQCERTKLVAESGRIACELDSSEAKHHSPWKLQAISKSVSAY